MSEKSVNCPHCGTPNLASNQYCAKCSQALAQSPATAEQSEPKSKWSLRATARAVIDVITPGSRKTVTSQSPSEITASPPSAVLTTRPLMNNTPLAAGEMIEDRYVVLKPYPLPHSNYYDVYDLQCGKCDQRSQPTPAGICSHCQTLLPRFLLRESRESREEAIGNLSDPELIQLSQSNPFVVPHYQIRRYGDRVFIWLRFPTQWRSLAKVKTPVPTDQIITWGQNIAGALAGLAGYAYYDPHPSGIEKIIIEGGTARLADLTSCRRGETDKPDVGVQRDTYFLACILYRLLTGKNLVREGQNIASAPQPLRAVIERAVRGEYRTVDEMLVDLNRYGVKDDYGLSLKPTSGKASDPGRERQNNEDSLMVLELTRVQESRGVPIGLYVVADGMGGHQAGEIASRTVNKIITERVLNAEVIPGLKFSTRRLDETPEGVLRSAIQESNRMLYHQARAKSSNMGTTLTAALLIGDTATIANVGDSRTYLLRRGELKQITSDHSLVASLVAAGVIKPEEMREHPQRNQIYRNLGDKPEVEVDTFIEPLQRGDFLILCSDGLWEMVSDVEIRRQVQSAATPQAACDELIRQANATGGEDNITVIVVKLE